MSALRFRFTTIAAALAVSMTSYAPVQAMPLPAVPAPSIQDVVNEVQYRRDRREIRRDRHRREVRRDHRRGYYRGYRGHRERRPHHRYHNGFWFPLAAFTAGAIIGGATQQARPSSNSRHVEWCINRFRSYRVSDNTFQPYNGPRRQCVSPYS